MEVRAIVCDDVEIGPCEYRIFLIVEVDITLYQQFKHIKYHVVKQPCLLPSIKALLGRETGVVQEWDNATVPPT
jgi:hypothetical protein